MIQLNIATTEFYKDSINSLRMLKIRKFGKIYQSYSVNNFNLAQSLLDERLNVHSSAFHYRGLSITREQLRKQVFELAHSFKNSGICANDRVMLCLNDSPGFHVCFLALISIGAIPIPLNPQLKQETLKYIVDNSAAKAIVVGNDSPILQSISENGVFFTAIQIFTQDLYIDSLVPSKDYKSIPLSKLLTGCSASEVYLSKQNDPAFWQYTSGTTGYPKAVVHSGAGMLRSHELFACGTLQLTADDRVYSSAKLFFGYGLGNSLFFPLLSGCECLLDHRWSTIEVVIENLNYYKPTVFFAVPATYAILLKNLQHLDPKVIENLRICFSAGSPLPKKIYHEWNHATGLNIYDGLGATEIGHVFLTNSEKHCKPGSCGKPVKGYQLKLVSDKQLDEFPKRQMGVLYVKGPSLGLEYWQDSSKTAEKFINGWYRTGDIVSRDEEGFYYYHSREDDLFKIKGRWVDPQEVEQLVLGNFNYVLEAALIPFEDQDGISQGVLFLSINDDLDVQTLEREITFLLTERLDSHKLPNCIRFTRQLPRNENGKLVRNQLRALLQTKAEHYGC